MSVQAVCDRRPLSRGQVLAQQRRRRGLRAILPQAHHLAVHDIRQHSPKALAFSALNFIEPDVAGLSFRAHAIPIGQKGFLGTACFLPTHAMAHGRVAGRHRLTVHANLLAQAPRDARFRVRELDPLGANPAATTPDAALPIYQGHWVRGPWQIVPCPFLRRAHVARPPATPTARITVTAPFNMQAYSTSRLRVRALD
jgi:hypothetical protein